jgi:two-component system chemotaxis sensor kinase CheA
MTTGHEEEFRRLFEDEARKRLAELGELALELETRGADAELVDTMFRHAHTLKGSAGVVGFRELAGVLHVLEQLLEDLRDGRRPATRELADAILGVVDALGDMIPRAMAGEDQRGARLAAEAAVARAPAAGTELLPSAPAAAAPAPAPAPAAPASPGGADDAASIAVPVSRLDELVRLVGEGTAAQLRVGRLISTRLGDDPAALDEYRHLARVLGTLQEQAMRARMVGVGTIAGPLRRAARDIANESGKEIRWEIEGEDTELDRTVLERLREPLVALVRNAVDHGIEPVAERERLGKPAAGLIRLHATQVGADVIVSVADDGRGIDLERVRAAAPGGELSDEEAMAAIFRPGLSTARRLTNVSGRGVGLDAVREAVDELRGRIEVHSAPGHGSEFRISVPMTLAVVRCLIVRAAGRDYALPLGAVTALLPAGTEELSAEGRPAVWFGTDALPLSDLSAVLGGEAGDARGPVAVVSTPTARHALRVQALLGQRDVVVKELGRVLPRLDLLSGASVEPDGSVMLVLDPQGLVDAGAGRERTRAAVGAAARGELPAAPRTASILVVEDAHTIRELLRAILERAGYQVAVAASAEAALERLQDADLVLTDVEMPGMDGFELTESIRASGEHRHLPVIVLTTRAEEADRRRGVEAGCDGYLVKRSFDEHALLSMVRRLLDVRPEGIAR